MSRLNRLSAVAALAATGLAMPLAEPAPAATLDGFHLANYDFMNNGIDSDDLSGSGDLQGRVYMPTGTSATAPVDLVIYLHGAGESGVHNMEHIFSNNIDNLVNAARQQGFAVYAPQTNSGWGIEQIHRVMKTAAAITDKYHINRDRIAVTGLSLGGGGTWTAMYNYGDMLAAGVPIAGVYGQGDPARAVDRPIWAFHGRGDPLVGVSASRNQVNLIREAAGSAPWTFLPAGSPTTTYAEGQLRYTEIDSTRHDVWHQTYADASLYEWLTEQKVEHTRLNVGETVAFDLGGTPLSGGVDGEGITWNSTTPGLEKTLSAAVAFARDTTGRRLGVHLSVADDFSLNPFSGITDGTGLDPDIAGDGWGVGSLSGHSAARQEKGELTLSGLDSGGEYEVRLFGSMAGAGTGIALAQYMIDGEVRLLDIFNNVDQWATFQSVRADAEGRITISVAVADDGVTPWAPLNALTVTAIPEPSTTAGLLMLWLGARYRRPRGRPSACTS